MDMMTGKVDQGRGQVIFVSYLGCNEDEDINIEVNCVDLWCKQQVESLYKLKFENILIKSGTFRNILSKM